MGRGKAITILSLILVIVGITLVGYMAQYSTCSSTLDFYQKEYKQLRKAVPNKCVGNCMIKAQGDGNPANFDNCLRRCY